MNDILVKKIGRMLEFDQGARRGSLSEGAFAKYTVYAVDAGNSHLIRQIVRDFGYPTADLVGSEGMHAFWLLVQHQDMDPSLQSDCLRECDFAAVDRAMLTDRVLVNDGRKQLYGTQFHRVNGELVPCPIDDEANVDSRRLTLGLPPMQEETDGMRDRDVENKTLRNAA